MSLITINCYNCGSSEYSLYDIENGYKYVKCKNCNLIYLNPRPVNEDISASHKIGEHRGNKLINVTGKYKKQKITKYVNTLKDFYKKDELENKNWLDIGCGFGEFMEALILYTNSEIKIKGSEPNKYKIQSCKSRELDVSFIDLDNWDEKYDFISLLNVYSHLPDPIEFLKKIKRFLNPNGELFIETGHSSHLPVKYHQKPYYAPDHLSFANKEIVENILQRLGFEIIKTEVYRVENFPRITDIKGNLKQLARIFLRRGGSWSNLLAKYPNRDMFIRARLKR
ncbi:MAG TPA: class I SAM-dependent methyltransferase [Ferruginibacter sp.]|jgi:SAM-dependent methyltransferase|nr:class I SAM-dependent methyltransferase [Ferruginibacter sp.]